MSTRYEEKLAEFLRVCEWSKEKDLDPLLIAHPEVLGDDCAEIIESPNLADAKPTLSSLGRSSSTTRSASTPLVVAAAPRSISRDQRRCAPTSSLRGQAGGVKLVVLVALLVCVEAARASACEPPPPSQLRDVLPADGATGVPANAQVRLDYDGGETTGLENVELRPVGGAALATTIALLNNAGYSLRHLVVVHLQASLAPQTQYEVRAGGTVVSTFRTGDSADTTPPRFAGITSVTTSVTDCQSSACCGPNRIAYVHVGWGGASDDFSVAMVRYNVYGTGGALVVPMTSHSAVGYQLCSGGLTGSGPSGNFQGGSGGYRVRAVDLAGNEDTNEVTQDVVVSCELPDGGSGDGASSPAGGCGCTTAGGSPSALAVPLLLVLWCLRSTKTRVRRGRAGSGQRMAHND